MSFGNVDDPEHLPSRQRRMGVGERIGANRDGDRLIGVQGLDKIAAELGVILVDDRDRDLAQELAEIGLRIEESVKDRGEDDQAEDAAVVEDAAQFGGHGGSGARAGEGWLGGRRLGSARCRGRGNGAEP